MSEKEEIEALNAENSTLRDIIDEQNESIAELRQQVADLQASLESSKEESHSSAQVRYDTFLIAPPLNLVLTLSSLTTGEKRP